MNIRVLIVDDEPNIVISLEFLMRQEGYEVAVAADGDEALELLEGFRPDLVLLDVMMPKMSGFDVLQRIRTHADLPKPAVIMLTARGREAEVEKGKALGADAYVTKPFATRDLVAKVRETLEGR
ncbi:MAG: response regulator [Acidimicrobiia bacterium]|nr:response regulator [Acidimicrobiia bacterium]